MVTTVDCTHPVSFKDLVSSLVTSASDAAHRDQVGRLLPRLDEKAVRGMGDANDRALARAWLSEAYLVAHGPDAALRALKGSLVECRSVENEEIRGGILLQAALSAASVGSLGTELLDQIEKLAAELSPSLIRARLFATLSRAGAMAGDPRRSQKTAIRALNSAEKIEDLADRVDALTAVASELHQGGDKSCIGDALERAHSLLERIEEPEAANRATLQVAAAYGRTGRPGEGLELLARALAVETTEPEAPVAEPDTFEVLDEVVEEAPAPAPAPQSRPAEKVEATTIAAIPGNGHDTNTAAENANDDVELNDPTKGVAFPKFSGGRRRRR